MIDRDKVIKGIECCLAVTKCGECPYNSGKDLWCGNNDQLLTDALELLKAQEPVEPVVDIDTLKCRNCGHALEHQELLGDNVLFHEQYNYCPECGMAVKWE